MKSVKLDKEDVKGPDAFLKASAKARDFLKEFKGLILGAVGIILILGVAYSIYDAYTSHVEEKAQEQLFFARKQADPEIGNLMNQTPKKENVSLSEQAIKSYEEVIQKFPHSRAGVIAALELSQFYLDTKKNSEALKILKEASNGVRENHVLFGLYTLQVAKALQVNNQCEEALTNLEKLANNAKLNMFKPEALLRSAICHENLKHYDKAKEIYERIGHEFPSSSASESAGKLLRSLKQGSNSDSHYGDNTGKG